MVNHVAPMAVSFAEPFADVSARGRHSCGLVRRDGVVACWGRNFNGQVGRDPSLGPAPVPVEVEGLAEPALEVDAGSEHTCARTATGVWCWGSNSLRQLAAPSTVTASYMPVEVTGISGRVVEVEAGFVHTCVRLDTGAVECWGGNPWGQVTPGGASTVPTPTAVTLPSASVEVSAGDAHTCARLDTDEVWCWGENVRGQLGDGTTTTPSMPVRVMW
jgi:alpha-tubulin suppressor-like RCC1 family protein